MVKQYNNLIGTNQKSIPIHYHTYSADRKGLLQADNHSQDWYHRYNIPQSHINSKNSPNRNLQNDCPTGIVVYRKTLLQLFPIQPL